MCIKKGEGLSLSHSFELFLNDKSARGALATGTWCMSIFFLSVEIIQILPTFFLNLSINIIFRQEVLIKSGHRA